MTKMVNNAIEYIYWKKSINQLSITSIFEFLITVISIRFLNLCNIDFPCFLLLSPFPVVFAHNSFSKLCNLVSRLRLSPCLMHNEWFPASSKACEPPSEFALSISHALSPALPGKRSCIIERYPSGHKQLNNWQVAAAARSLLSARQGRFRARVRMKQGGFVWISGIPTFFRSPPPRDSFSML